MSAILESLLTQEQRTAASDHDRALQHYVPMAAQAAFLASQPPGEYLEAVQAILRAASLVAELDKTGSWVGTDDVSAMLDAAFDAMQDRVYRV